MPKEHRNAMEPAKTALLAHFGEYRRQTLSSLSESRAFVYYCAEQCLKYLDLQASEIASRITDKHNDGDIDFMLTLVNGIPCDATDNEPRVKSDVELHFIFLQASMHDGFEESVLKTLAWSVPLILRSDAMTSQLRKAFNRELLDQIKVLQHTKKIYLSTLPSFRITIFYCTSGNTNNVSSAQQAQLESLKSSVTSLFTNVTIEVELIGAKELTDKARYSFVAPKILDFPYGYSTGQDNQSVAGLMRLEDFHDALLIDSQGHLMRSLFEFNVRDYEGDDVAVNAEIIETLRETHNTPDFWWLNNGVTVLCNESNPQGRRVTVRDPRIVNGLQTSMAIYQYFRDGGRRGEDRHVLLKVLPTSNEESREAIIRATNSQTTLKPEAFYALDSTQWQIEQILLNSGFFYERRKNQYKRLGKSIDRLITPVYLAQCLASTLLARPNFARARPRDLIAKKEYREQLYGSHLPASCYINALELGRGANEFLAAKVIELGRPAITNLRWYLVFQVAFELLGSKKFKASDLAGIDPASVNGTFLERALSKVKRIFSSLESSSGMTEERLAKGTLIIDKLYPYKRRD